MTMPLWIILLSLGIPTACLIMLVTGLLQMKRKQQKIRRNAIPSQPAMNLSSFGQQICRQAMTQQIDAVFNALTAVIETERIKLKALMMHSLPDGEFSSSAPARAQIQPFNEENLEPATSEESFDLGENVVSLATDGMKPEQIAKRLGLSHNEVALALKMRQGTERRRLEAVA